MATTSIAVQNELLSTTSHVHLKEWKDALHTSIALLDAWKRTYGDAHGEQQDGGTRIIVPVALGEHSTTTRVRTGFEEINVTASDIFVPAVYTWAHAVRPIMIALEEERQNSGPSAVVDIALARVKQVANALRRDFIEHIIAFGDGDNGVAGFEDWNHLNGIDDTTGILEEDAVASQDNSVGGISKATYATSTGWRNQIYDGAGSFNSNGLAGLYDLMVEIESVSPEGRPDIILASRAAFKHLKRAVQAYERYVNEKDIDAGMMVSLFDGVRINAEYYMPAITGQGSATDPASFYFLHSKLLYPVWDAKIGFFELDDFQDIAGNFDVRVAKLHVRGQLIAAHLGGLGLGFDLNTF